MNDTTVDSLIRVLDRAHTNLDRLGVPPAPPHQQWTNWRRAHRAKFNEAEARALHNRWANGATMPDLAAEHGVSKSTVLRTIRRLERKP